MPLIATFPEGTLFRDIVSSVSGTLTDLTFSCSASGIALEAMDAGHVAFVWLHIPAYDFKDFQCDIPFEFSIGISVLLNALKQFKDYHEVQIETGLNSATLIVRAFKDNKCAVEFEFSLMDIDAERLVVPPKHNSASVDADATEIRQCLQHNEWVGETVEIIITPVELRLIVSGTSAKMTFTLAHEDDESAKCRISMEPGLKMIKYTYTLRNIISFMKASVLSNRVVIHMTPDMPIEFMFRVGISGSLKFYLAPKILDEESAS